MIVNTMIQQKCQYYLRYLHDNQYTDKLFDKSRKTTYSLDTYLIMYFQFQKSGVSYEIFYDIINLKASLGINNYPKKTALTDFKHKLAKYKINETIHNNHIT